MLSLLYASPVHEIAADFLIQLQNAKLSFLLGKETTKHNGDSILYRFAILSSCS